MSEETCECFCDQFYDASQYEGRTNDFPVKEEDVPRISFQNHQMENTDEACHNDFEYFPKRISVKDFSVPTFEMRLAANQGNLQQLASILSVKQTTVKRSIRPKFEEFQAIPAESAMPLVFCVHHQGSVETERCSFPDTLPEILHMVFQEEQEKECKRC